MTVSKLTKAALIILPVTMLGACGMFDEQPQTAAATTDIESRRLSQQNAARLERLESRDAEAQERIYNRSLRK